MYICWDHKPVGWLLLAQFVTASDCTHISCASTSGCPIFHRILAHSADSELCAAALPVGVLKYLKTIRVPQ